MNFLKKITALIPFGKKEEILEYFFALNISSEKLTSALWTIEGGQLKILGTASEEYSSLDDLLPITDKLLDQSLGVREVDPQKILFGVPSSWLADENLKEEKIKVLRTLVKELELTPMAYVENSHALIHFLEKTEGVPPTAILVEFEAHHLTVTVVRAGKLDGVKIIQRGEKSGADIEKALLTFSAVETLPSKILIYGKDVAQLKNQLLSYSWMSKLSFLHFPKIDTLPDDIEIKSVCFAGASEIDSNVSYNEKAIAQATKTSAVVGLKEDELKELDSGDKQVKEDSRKESLEKEDLGFVVGDVSEKMTEENLEDEYGEENVLPQESNLVEVDDFESELPVSQESHLPPAKTYAGKLGFVSHYLSKLPLKKFLPRKLKHNAILGGVVAVFVLLIGAFLIFPKAEVKIFVEPKILEKDTTVTADPNQKTVNEDSKIIPGQIVETEVSGTAKEQATGKKQIGNPAKGTVKIINNSSSPQTLSSGTTLTANGIRFALDTTVNIASTSAISDSKSTATATVTASAVGADGNVPSGTQFSSANQQVAVVAEGNFSGGTSKEVTVVSSDDQSRLLASLASDLRQQAQAKLQEKLPEKKILTEALSETIAKRAFNKNVNDQASEFSLDLTTRYKGTAFEDKDLKGIVSKLVVTQVPEGFKLNLEDTETQADVSKLEKDGKLIFLAKFKAKLMPQINEEEIKNKIKGKDIKQALEVIKGVENILGAEIKITPAIPFLQRLPMLSKNISVEVGLK